MTPRTRPSESPVATINLNVETGQLLVEGKKYAKLGSAVCQFFCQEISWIPKLFHRICHPPLNALFCTMKKPHRNLWCPSPDRRVIDKILWTWSWDPASLEEKFLFFNKSAHSIEKTSNIPFMSNPGIPDYRSVCPPTNLPQTDFFGLLEIVLSQKWSPLTPFQWAFLRQDEASQSLCHIWPRWKKVAFARSGIGRDFVYVKSPIIVQSSKHPFCAPSNTLLQ